MFCICFDLDGVLIDSWRCMRSSFDAALTACSVVPHPRHLAGFRDLQGATLERIATELGLPDGFPSQYRAACPRFYGQIRLYQGARQLLKRLSDAGFLLAVNTGKELRRTEEVLTRFRIRRFFSAVVTGDAVTHAKPHPESLRLVGELTGCTGEEMLYIGDSPLDIACARAAGVASVAALWGIGEETALRLAEPDRVGQCPMDLLDICLGQRSRLSRSAATVL